MPLFVQVKDGMKHAGHGPGEDIEVTEDELASFGDKFTLPSDHASNVPDDLTYPSPDPALVVDDGAYVVRVKAGLKHAGHAGGEIIVVTAAEVRSFHDKFEVVPSEMIGDEVERIVAKGTSAIDVDLAKRLMKSMMVRPVINYPEVVEDDHIVEYKDESEPEPPKKRRPFSATPPAMALAVEHGIDLATVDGTGANGRVTKKDVEDAIG